MIVIMRRPGESPRLAKVIQAMGVEVGYQPLLTIKPVEHTPPPNTITHLIITSKNGLNALISKHNYQSMRDMPTYIVGQTTAEAAHKLGFNHITVRPRAQDLDGLITTANINPEQTHFYYLRGRDIAYDLVSSLKSKGYKIHDTIGYQADAVSSLNSHFYHAIENEQVSLMLFFSRRAAEAFVSLYHQKPIPQALAKISALSLSNRISCVLGDLGFQATHHASLPTDDAMLALTKTFFPNTNNDNKTN